MKEQVQVAPNTGWCALYLKGRGQVGGGGGMEGVGVTFEENSERFCFEHTTFQMPIRHLYGKNPFNI